MQCPRCNKEKIKRNGFVVDKQRFKCKSCNFSFTLHEPLGKPKEIKRLAIHMYLEGLGFRSIGRILDVSNVAVLKWIRNASHEVASFVETKDKNKEEIKVMELDEMWHFVSKKNTKSGSGWLLIELPKTLLPHKQVIAVTKLE